LFHLLSAQPGRDPRELTTAEGFDLIDQVAALGTPILILSGGDPVNRPDLFELVRHGKARGLRVATIPGATDSLTRELVQELKAAGLDQMAVSIDFLLGVLRRTPQAEPRSRDCQI
jgi:MoaA/NifB/PqqE/SkfB family radical SAM enzyme